jgi:hypothetical protein
MQAKALSLALSSCHNVMHHQYWIFLASPSGLTVKFGCGKLVPIRRSSFGPSWRSARAPRGLCRGSTVTTPTYHLQLRHLSQPGESNCCSACTRTPARLHMASTANGCQCAVTSPFIHNIASAGRHHARENCFGRRDLFTATYHSIAELEPSTKRVS